MCPTTQAPKTDVQGATIAETAVEVERGNWVGAMAGGIIAGALMAVPMAVLAEPMLTEAIPALYGLEGGFAGVFLHLSHAAVFGVVFAAIVQLDRFASYGETVRRSTLAGLAYGLAIWLVAGAFVMPVWLNAVGITASIPTFDTTSLVAHAVFGVALGALYPYVAKY
ncbi:histidine kinase [Natronomonas sp. EA1]|uniref:histidine kinase n=1 Tax=Natronomonas sp. EA1 TaxID=3421655 RepID=UPI003EBF8A2E